MSVSAGSYHKRAAKLLLSEVTGEDPYRMEEFKQNRECVPVYLYKYHGVDDYTLDALVNGYVYIASASLMDDQFELALNAADGIRDITELHLFDDRYIGYLWDTLAKQSPSFAKVIRSMREELSAGASVSDSVAYMRERIGEDPDLYEVRERLSELSGTAAYERYMKLFLEGILKVKEMFGIHSLTEDKYNQVMWCMYGSDYKGILIEYDMSTADDSFIKNLVKVHYSDFRDADPMKLFADMLVSVLLKTEGNEYYELKLLEWVLKVLATKNDEWSFQKEWRVISNPSEKIPSPKVSAIYLGKRISDEDREKVLSVAEARGIRILEQRDDFEKMTVCYI